MTPDIQLTVPALFGLIGAFVGAWLTRRTEYEKWYRQEKSIAFAEYLRQLHDTRFRASDAFDSIEGTEQSRSMKATEEFVRLEKFTAQARLYMSMDARRSLSDLQHKLWIYCSTKGGPSSWTKELQADMEAIQVLLEAELERIPGKLRWSL